MKKLWMIIALISLGIFFNSCEDDDGDDCTPTTWYEDADGDGLGNPEVTMESCDQPEGYVGNADDDNDTGANVISNEYFSYVSDDLDYVVEKQIDFSNEDWKFTIAQKIKSVITNVSGQDLQVQVYLDFVNTPGHSISFCDNQNCYTGIDDSQFVGPQGDFGVDPNTMLWPAGKEANKDRIFVSDYLFEIVPYRSLEKDPFSPDFDPETDLLSGKTMIDVYLIDPNSNGETFADRAYIVIPTSVDFRINQN